MQSHDTKFVLDQRVIFKLLGGPYDGVCDSLVHREWGEAFWALSRAGEIGHLFFIFAPAVLEAEILLSQGTLERTHEYLVSGREEANGVVTVTCTYIGIGNSRPKT